MFRRKQIRSINETANEKVIAAHRLIQALETALSELPGRYYLKFVPGDRRPRHVTLMDSLFCPPVDMSSSTEETVEAHD